MLNRYSKLILFILYTKNNCISNSISKFNFSSDDVKSIISGKLALRYAGVEVNLGLNAIKIYICNIT